MKSVMTLRQARPSRHRSHAKWRCDDLRTEAIAPPVTEQVVLTRESQDRLLTVGRVHNAEGFDKKYISSQNLPQAAITGLEVLAHRPAMAFSVRIGG